MPPDRDDHLPERLRVRRASALLPAVSQAEAAPPLPAPVSHHIEAIRLLQRRADESLSRSHRPLETVRAL